MNEATVCFNLCIIKKYSKDEIFCFYYLTNQQSFLKLRILSCISVRHLRSAQRSARRRKATRSGSASARRRRRRSARRSWRRSCYWSRLRTTRRCVSCSGSPRSTAPKASQWPATRSTWRTSSQRTSTGARAPTPHPCASRRAPDHHLFSWHSVVSTVLDF